MALEDFTAYTEVDSEGHMAVTATKLDADSISRDESVQCYADKDADHFGAAFEIDYKLTALTAGSVNGACATVGVSNSTNGYHDWETNDRDAVCGYVTTSGWSGYDITLGLNDCAGNETDTRTESSQVVYYPKFKRSNAGATVELEFYSDESQETLVDTLTVTINGATAYQYIFGINNLEYPQSSYYLSIDVENLDLNEGAPPAGAVGRLLKETELGNSLFGGLIHVA